jgi:hypothetical protein
MILTRSIERQWSAEIFIPLDAEVEVRSGSSRTKKLTDLLSAIRSERKSRTFLVLGDPGSGKSVALRKLCRELLKEVEATGKVPLYVNLREWETRDRWTEQSPPTVDQLYAFVQNNLADRGDVFTKDFLDTYFHKMFEGGRLFIVLDSFDELPAIMDVNEDSWLINSLSSVCYRFLAGAHESRGILASRIFRRPTAAFAAQSTLEIKPFSEQQIVSTLKKSFSYDESLVRTLFTERQEFVPIARNPFTAGLISSYAAEHQNTLPSSQAELYSSYVQHRLQSCIDRIRSSGLTKQRVIQGAIDIADVMLTTERLGLEAALTDLIQLLPNQRVSDIVDVLRFARIGRVGGGNEKRFSFVHRRFNEYFVVQKLLENPGRAPIADIPTDSRWRDALVLYCEIADSQHAKEIAEFCWKEILAGWTDSMNNPKYLRAVHCLRFLKDAFRARSELLSSFRDKLATAIKSEVSSSENLLSKKIAVDTLGILATEDVDEVLQAVFVQNNSWLDEAALKSCHYLPRMSDKLIDNVIVFVQAMGAWQFLRRRRELLFAFSLSHAFEDIRRFCIWKTIDLYALAGAYALSFAMLFLILPPLALSWLVLFSWMPFLPGSWVRRWKALVAARMFFWLLLMAPWFFLLIFWPFRLAESILQPLGILVIISWIVGLPIYHIIYYWSRTITGLTHTSRTIGTLLVNLWDSLVYMWDSRKFIVYLFRTLRMLIAFAAVISILSLLTWFLNTITPPQILTSLSEIFKVVFLMFSVVMLVYLTYIIVPVTAIKRRDRQRLKSLKTKLPTNRAQISAEFISFKTSEFRAKFVKLLEERGIKPTGWWPDGVLPNQNNDEASTLLAQLEEKWLGLTH